MDRAALASQELEEIASREYFEQHAAELADGWTASGAGIEFVEPVLRFMEEHPALEYGSPGALVHFLERFAKQGFEPMLVESLRRRPTRPTVWMLNRVINVVSSATERQTLLSEMEAAAKHPLADELTILDAQDFLAYQNQLGETE